VRQVEPAAIGDADAVGQGLRPLGEEDGHLQRRLQVVLGVLAAQGVGGVERRAVADGDQHVLESMALPQVVVDVVGGDVAQAEPLGQLHQRPVAGLISVDKVVLELDPVAVLPEDSQVVTGRRLRLSILPLGDQRRHLALLAAGEGDESLAVSGERLEVQRRLAALVRQVSVGEQ
jgi:hypothetical protein